MVEKDLRELISDSGKICDLLYEHNVGNCRSRPVRLSAQLRRELLKFAAYLADADGILSEQEIGVVQEYLGVTMDRELLEDFKRRDFLDGRYAKERPAVIKYAVLADAGRKISPDPYHNQKAQLLYDTYSRFGELFVANREEVSGRAVERYTRYMQMLEKFLREYGVAYTSGAKFYQFASGVPKPVEGAAEVPPEERIEKALGALDGMVGLETVKEEMHSLVNLMKVRKLREEKGMKNSAVSMHMVFSGNPGTGKTTVARMLAQIYEALGVLSGGQLVEVDRSGLVRGFVGQTATRVQEVVDEALGGILFVDEAYTLCVGKGENDFGQEAIDTLLKAMEDHREDFVVIVAGYPDLMEEFLDSNPGLKSRFNKFIFFEDYTPDEQLAILKSMCAKLDYVLTQEAEECAFEWMKRRYAKRPDNFANARDIRNFMEKAISRQATRIVALGDLDEKMLATVERTDVEAVIRSYEGSGVS